MNVPLTMCTKLRIKQNEQTQKAGECLVVFVCTNSNIICLHRKIRRGFIWRFVLTLPQECHHWQCYPVWVRQEAVIRALVAAAVSWHLLLELADCRYILIRLSLGHKHMQQVLFECTRQPKGQLCAPSVSKCISVSGARGAVSRRLSRSDTDGCRRRGGGLTGKLLLPLLCVIINSTPTVISHSLSKPMWEV